MEYVTGTLYSCECGYKSLSAAGSLKHSKTKKCVNNATVKTEMRFALTESRDIDCDIIDTEQDDIAEKQDDINNKNNDIVLVQQEIISKKSDIIKKKDDVILLQHAKIRRLRASLSNLSNTTSDAEDEDSQEGTGIIYFIVDKDVQDRGKIGRTKNTDIKRLKTRYSIFGNPDILCHWSTDIQKDENTLKKLLRDAGCMESHKEMIFNIKIARRVFYEFIEM